MKKLLAFSLAALMVLGLATTAFAAQPSNPSLKVLDPIVKDVTIDGSATTANSKNAVGFVSNFGYVENSSGEVAIPTSGDGVDKVAPGGTIYYPLFTAAGAAQENATGTPSAELLGGSTPDFTNEMHTLQDGLYGPAANITGSNNVNLVTLADAVKSVSISTKYTLGQDLIDNIKVVYKKFIIGSSTGYSYMLALTFKSSTSVSSRDFAADITIKKSSGTDSTITAPGDGTLLGFNTRVGVSIPVSFADASPTLVDTSWKIHRIKDLDGDYTFDFKSFDGATFEVEISGQGNILMRANNTYDSSVASKYPAANINFFNGFNVSFNKIGLLTLPAAPGSYLYAVNADGSLSAVNAEYDDGAEAFLIKTRTLGKYAIADKELNIAPAAPSVSEAPVEAPVDPTPVAPAPSEPNKTNPGTGAAA